ncbi:TRAP transporter substrate-binding protein DctP [Limobrevibacterium gyesilva]|uniref:TRAP transporter substrate-binding protein DctP n=1 Tax=Limobrevibacterium gyesilva TaxID=2991712 RepID=A0AA42CJD9_9PROT|nr:TRAP transporter substrate-binding protein DctP [Limobrevibacterium gyesilva]MCW3476807.1 TRAP transporter substrate-binding protein DctP [Limobrevibacterium gyesilva]
MQKNITRRRLAIAAAAVAAGGALPRRAAAAEPIRLRCSLDTAPTHMRNVSMGDYLKKLEAGSGGRIKTELFSAGALFKDANVAKALVQGQVEMACPGTWVMTGFIPDNDVVNLPMLYGQPLEVVRKALDGKTGAFINAQSKAKLRVHVLGPWLELGMEHWYSAGRPLKSFADLKGMKIRNAGGAALAWRTRFFDGNPNTTAWPDVPLALSQGTFDGLISTNESCFSSKLWEAGLKYSLQDHQNVNAYVPMISDSFYTSLPADLQKLVVDLWRENIAAYRANMAASQDKAYEELKAHGLQMVAPEAAEIADIRKRMLPEQDKLMKELKMSADLHKLLAEDLGSSV